MNHYEVVKINEGYKINVDNKVSYSGPRLVFMIKLLVQSIYGKKQPNPQKIATKGFSTGFGRFEYTF